MKNNIKTGEAIREILSSIPFNVSRQWKYTLIYIEKSSS